jgi:hypothetical protein
MSEEPLQEEEEEQAAPQELDENRVVDFILQSEFVEISGICERLRKAAPASSTVTAKASKAMSPSSQRVIREATRDLLDFQADYQNRALASCLETTSA